MFRLNNLALSLNSVTTNEIGFNVNNDNIIMNFTNQQNKYSYTLTCFPLIKNSRHIPLICAVNSDVSTMSVTKDNFLQNAQQYLSRIISSNDQLLNTLNNNTIKQNIEQIYDIINSNFEKNYSRNIPMKTPYRYNNSTITIDTQKELLLNRNYKRIVTSGDLLMGTFYYKVADKILLLLVVKNEHLVEFKRNLIDDQINPEHVEIWVDKEFIQQEDKKKLHKWIREVLMMKLVMNGFKIVEKDDILSELIYLPKIKFNSPSEINEFRVNLNKFLLHE